MEEKEKWQNNDDYTKNKTKEKIELHKDNTKKKKMKRKRSTKIKVENTAINDKTTNKKRRKK